MYFMSSIGDAIRIPLRLTLSLLSCFSLGVVQLTRAAPTTEPAITAEQYPGLHLHTPKIFFPSFDSQVSQSILSDQTNHTEIDMASPKRLYTCCISFLLYVLYIYIVHWSHVVKWNIIILSYYMTISEVPGNLAICDGLSWMPSLFISACLSGAFVDGPGSWASRAVAWVQSNRSSKKTLFECRLFFAQACLLESPVLERKSEGKT